MRIDELEEKLRDAELRANAGEKKARMFEADWMAANSRWAETSSRLRRDKAAADAELEQWRDLGRRALGVLRVGLGNGPGGAQKLCGEIEAMLIAPDGGPRP